MNGQDILNIPERISELVAGKWPGTPVGKRMGFVQLGSMQAINKIGIGDLCAVADHCSRNLGIEKWFGNLASMSRQEIKILSASVNDLLDIGPTDNFPEGIKRSLGEDCWKIDDGGGSFRCDLNQLEARDEGLFPDKFRVDGEPRTLMEFLAQCFESPAIGDVL
jgi:hypothetical protein